jgi:hypothetical protein
VGLAADEQRERQNEIFQRFSRDVLGNSSADVSVDDSDGQPLPDPDASNPVVSDNGFQMANDDEPAPSAPVVWRPAPDFAEQRRLAAEAAAARFPEWMSEADKHMTAIEGLEPVPWEKFVNAAHCRGEMESKAIEQRGFEECSVAPGPDNDVIVGVALVVNKQRNIYAGGPRSVPPSPSDILSP